MIKFSDVHYVVSQYYLQKIINLFVLFQKHLLVQNAHEKGEPSNKNISKFGDC